MHNSRRFIRLCPIIFISQTHSDKFREHAVENTYGPKKKIWQNDLSKEILRAAIMAELDAINLYEEIANLTPKKGLKTIPLDVA